MSSTQSSSSSTYESKLKLLSRALESGALLPVKNMLETLHPAEIAHVIESAPPQQRKLIWQLLEQGSRGDVLVELGEEVRSGLLQSMPVQAVVKATEGLDTDDLADLIQTLPSEVTHQVLRVMSARDRQRLNKVIAFDEDTAGGIMNTDALSIRADVTIDVVQRYLRLRRTLPANTDCLFVVDRRNRYLGTLPLEYLLTQDPDKEVADVMRTDLPVLDSGTTSESVAKTFERRDLISAPVTSEAGVLLGRITIDDVVDIIRDQADHHLMGRAGLSEDDDIFAPVLPSARRRALWLGINLLTALMASWVIGRFQTTLENIVALAVLMPIVASMGGVAGTQTLTLVIRAIALDQVGAQNTKWLLNKELAVGFLNGFTWAMVVGLIAYTWFGSAEIGGIIATAMVVNLLVASLAGVAIPLLLRRVSVDPALAGGVVLTTVTDVVGFLTFLGLATIIMG